MEDKKFELMLDNQLTSYTKSIRDKAICLWNSGAIDKESYCNNDYLPVLACAFIAAQDKAYKLRPVSGEGKKLMGNLKHF